MLGDLVSHKSYLEMRLRNRILSAISLADVEQLLNEWEIQCLILLSFALQVLLFLAAGIRRRNSSSRVIGVLIWLAYLSADSVAIFVLGHLAVHAGGPSHQLVFLWAPFLLLHLGGQDTITAFSMQDNELWRRHLLTFAQQAALAVYVVTKSPWPDRRLLAAVMLIFLSGCVKYAERIVCLAAARPDRLMADFLGGFQDRISSIKEMQTIAREGGGLGSSTSRYLGSRAFAKMSLNPAMDVMSTDILPNYDWSVSRDIFADLHSKVSRLDHPRKEDYFRQTYRFAEQKLFVCYQRLYTKALFRLSPLGAFLHLVTFLSTSAATVLFYAAVSGGGADQARRSRTTSTTYYYYRLQLGRRLRDLRAARWRRDAGGVGFLPVHVHPARPLAAPGALLLRPQPPHHQVRLLPHVRQLRRHAEEVAAAAALVAEAGAVQRHRAMRPAAAGLRPLRVSVAPVHG